MAVQEPTLAVEQELFASGFRVVLGVDEVGRGAIAGPVAVGVHAVVAGASEFPPGLRDSKLLSEKRREELFPAVMAWGAGAVGMASAAEIDGHGISQGLARAALRALAEVCAEIPWHETVVLVDGKTDWVTPGIRQLSSALQNVGMAGDGAADVLGELLPAITAERLPALAGMTAALLGNGRVLTRVKADRDCAAVAAASIRAKVTRDRLLLRLAERYPGYGWESNKGYGAKAHYAGIAERGVTSYHRKTWLHNLPENPAA